MTEHIPSPQALVEHGLATSRSTDCMVVVEESAGANLRWANNTVTTNGAMSSTTATVIAFEPDGRTATMTGTATTRTEIEALVAAADAACREAAPADDRAPLVTGEAAADWEVPPGRTSINVYDDFAGALGDEFQRAAAESRVLYGFVDHDVTTSYVGSSTGLRLRHEQPTGHYTCTGKPADLSASAWVGGSTRDFTDVDAHVMAEELVRRLGWATRSEQLPAGRYDTVLPADAVADLMVDAYWSMSARWAADGQTVYSRRGGGTRIGDQIARPEVRLHSDPAYPGLACQPFALTSSSSAMASVFDNGMPLAPTDWISDGTLRALIQTRETAALTGQQVTPGIDNLVLDAGGTGTLDDLVARVEDGLLLTCLWYIREVDPQTLLLTGLTRDGVYRVRNGEIVGAVNNFRFNESPVDLLNRFTAASATEKAFSREWGDEYFGRTAMAALRIPDFNMSSVSQAL